MDYEEKYKTALERAKAMIKVVANQDEAICFANTIFPELAESENEDERIRKAISQCVEDMRGQFEKLYSVHHKDAIAWLEKQGIKPQSKSALEAIHEQKVDNSNRVEPKFKENDWITNGEDTIQITIVDTKSGHSGYYRCFEGSHGFGWYVIDIESTNKNYHLWSLQDAKNGDILAFDNDTIVIFKGLYNATTFHSYCYIEDGAFNISEDETPDWWEGKNFHPATKEQRDILFQKAKEAGYEWDAEKKKLREIKQKSSWSEEDDVKLNDTINLIEQSGNVRNIREHYISWLQSLKQRATWKPSNEQIKALRWVLNNVPCNKHKEEISGLLDQIKDL